MGSSGGKGGGGAGLDVPYENGCMQEAACESKAISALSVTLSCLKVISYRLINLPHLSARLQPKKTLCISLLFPLKASMILELGVHDRCLTSGLLDCPGLIWCIQG